MQPLKQMTISTWGKEPIKTLLCWAFFVLLQNYKLNAKNTEELSNKMWISLKPFVNKNYEIIKMALLSIYGGMRLNFAS